MFNISFRIVLVYNEIRNRNVLTADNTVTVKIIIFAFINQ